MSGSDSLRIIGCSSFGRAGLPRLACECGVAPFRLRTTSVSGFPRPWLNSRMPCGSSFRIPVSNREPAGSPKFLNASLHACHALKWTPADPRGPHRTIGPSVWASAAVKIVAVCIKRNDGAVSSFGEYGLSCGLHVSLCTLQLTCSVLPS